MEELSGVIEEALGDLITGGTNEILTTVNVIQETTQTSPDLIVHVQNLDTGSDVAGFVAQYIPFFDQYTDIEFFTFCGVALIWILCVIWVLRDAMARSNSSFYQFISVLLVVLLTPVVGIPLYLAFRPLVYKWERGVRREALEQTITECPHCGYYNKDTNHMCVWCGENLCTECKQCHTEYLGVYHYCPECGAPNLD